MNKNIFSLDKLPLNQKAKLESIYCENNIKRRLLDLGLVKNSYICPVLISPSGDPRAFEIRGSLIAIRDSECKKINVYQEQKRHD